MSFEINFDLNQINYKNWHNWFHFIGNIITGIILFFFLDITNETYLFISSYGIWLLWEIGDGFKPYYYLYNNNLNKSALCNWLRKELLYSDKFSLQDIFIWNFFGTIIVALFLPMLF